jgi:hypothetical protein
MKRLVLMIVSALICGVIFTSCGSDKAERTDNEEFCLNFNSENMNKTIPVINKFLTGLKNNLNDEQKLQALTEWLKSHPYINDATILCVSCIYTLPAQSEISSSINEDGKTEDFILDIWMSNPLIALGFHEHY